MTSTIGRKRTPKRDPLRSRLEHARCCLALAGEALDEGDRRGARVAIEGAIGSAREVLRAAAERRGGRGRVR